MKKVSRHSPSIQTVFLCLPSSIKPLVTQFTRLAGVSKPTNKGHLHFSIGSDGAAVVFENG